MNFSKRWTIIEPPSKELTKNLSNYPGILQTLLYRRGCKTVQEARCFLEALQPKDTIGVWPKGIDAAVYRILAAITKNERVIVHGDYDVDGITATALLVQILQMMGCDARPYIPNRFDDGYGLRSSQLHFFKMIHTDLIITVDCGIRSLEVAEKAKEMGIDLIITDHHSPGPDLPDALVIINPMQPGDSYPEKHLAGVGLAYKLAHALALSRRPPIKPNVFLDLVALGTVADMSPLLGENRYLVTQGLNKLRHTSRVGLRALAEIARIDLSTIQANDIGFTLGPRLNAAGRLGTSMLALNLILNDDLRSAKEKAEELDKLNKERQKLTKEAVWDARARANPDDFVICVYNPKYNPGIIGLIAARLCTMYYRPAVVICNVDGSARGSCRSIPEYPINDALDRQAGLLLSHGGHAAAAGFSITPENIPELADRLGLDAETLLKGKELRPTIRADAEIPLRDLDQEMLEALEWLQPYGEANPQPVFVSRWLRVEDPHTVGKDGTHLVMNLVDGNVHFNSIAFGQGQRLEELPDHVDVIYRLNCTRDANQQIVSAQLNLLDIKQSK